MVGWYYRLNGHESEQTPGHSKGQGGLECCKTRQWEAFMIQPKEKVIQEKENESIV